MAGPWSGLCSEARAGAVMIPPADIPALAARFQRFGALAQAEQLYRQAIQDQPGDAELWAGSGVSAMPSASPTRP